MFRDEDGVYLKIRDGNIKLLRLVAMLLCFSI